jgi:hypothetical protein
VKKPNLVYIGKRVFNGKTLCPCFLEKDGSLAFFPKVKWCQIGHGYVMTKDSRLAVRPESTGLVPEATETQIEIWEAEEFAARSLLARIRNENRGVEKWAGKTLREIAGIAARLPHSERMNFGEAVKVFVVFKGLWESNK